MEVKIGEPCFHRACWKYVGGELGHVGQIECAFDGGELHRDVGKELGADGGVVQAQGG